MKKYLKEKIKDAINDLGYGWEEDFSVEKSRNLNVGDYTSNVCFLMAKTVKKNPVDISANIASKMKLDNFEVNGEAGYINFYVKKDKLVLALKDTKKNKLGDGKKVLIDFSSPNIAKPMSVGHLRSTIIGDSLARVYKENGYEVIADNHLGDWGTQFGKLICAYKKWGSNIKEPSIADMLNLYVKFHNEEKNNPELSEEARGEFLKLENGDQENLTLWEKFKKASIVEFKKTYDILGVSFDKMCGESFYQDRLEDVINYALEKKVAIIDDGAVIIKDDEFQIPLLIRKKDGATLYATRELATIEYRVSDLKTDKIIYVVGNEQKSYFKQVFKTYKKLYNGCVDLEHVGFGLVRLPEGKMSTREGRIVYLDELIKKAIDKAKLIIEEKNPSLSDDDKEKVSKIVGIGAIKFNDLSQNRNTEIVFDYEKMLSFTGKSAPYIQYTYARICSVLEKANRNDYGNGIDLEKLTQEETNLLRLIYNFDDVIESVVISNMPNYIADYLYDLSNALNTFYQKEKIIGANVNQELKILLLKRVSKIIKKGLDLLGIEVVNKM